MEETERTEEGSRLSKLPAIAAAVALIGVADAAYLSVHHYTAVPVPCSIISGCETVLTSSYAEIAGVPLAAIGGAAYFAAFSLATLAAFGNGLIWKIFGALVSLMFLVTLYLLYLQAVVIGAFCQFCLVSAAVTVTLFALYVFSHRGRRETIRA